MKGVPETTEMSWQTASALARHDLFHTELGSVYRTSCIVETVAAALFLAGLAALCGWGAYESVFNYGDSFSVPLGVAGGTVFTTYMVFFVGMAVKSVLECIWTRRAMAGDTDENGRPFLAYLLHKTLQKATYDLEMCKKLEEEDPALAEMIVKQSERTIGIVTGKIKVVIHPKEIELIEQN